MFFVGKQNGCIGYFVRVRFFNFLLGNNIAVSFKPNMQNNKWYFRWLWLASFTFNFLLTIFFWLLSIDKSNWNYSLTLHGVSENDVIQSGVIQQVLMLFSPSIKWNSWYFFNGENFFLIKSIVWDERKQNKKRKNACILHRLQCDYCMCFNHRPCV